MLLLSDSMKIIELPLGIIKNEVKIGDPIKLKLEFDVNRIEQDRKKFQNLQRRFNK